jgi:uncharacterized membrane protein YraQ (UPF0718 family)
MAESGNQTPTVADASKRGVPWVRWWVALLVMVGVGGLLYALGGNEGPGRVLQKVSQRPADALLGIVNVFTCCVLSWKALTIMLPAFLLGGAISAFAPRVVILYYLGARSKPVRAYGAAALSGVLLSLCSCNIVPLFVSIYRRGAGLGPAFTFLFAGPAINVVSIVFTIQVIGWRVGIWRAIGVPLIAIVTGLLMGLIFREPDAVGATATAGEVQRPEIEGRVVGLLGLLLVMVVYGAWEMAWLPKLVGLGIVVAAVVGLALQLYEGWEVREWLGETFGLLKLVIPVLLPAILVIGGLAAYIDVKLVYRWLGAAPPDSGLWGTIRPVLVGDLFGALMYFPILSEVAFTKAFLTLGMDVGPALAILLTGAGLSLPGLMIIARAVGWVKACTYQLLVIALAAGVALVFNSWIGEYICACMMM